MRRSAISVVSNIAEGAARRSDRDFARFLVIAMGSAAELDAQSAVAGRLGMGRVADRTEVEDLVAETKRMLWGLLRAVRERL
jgi:four helix bundle protein